MTRVLTPEQKIARNAYQREYKKRPDVAEKIRERRRQRYQADPELRRRHSDYRRELVQRHREQGIHTETLVSRAQFDAMFKAQRGVCAICKKPETRVSAKGRVRRLSIDHDHRTGRIRALLCSRCNSVVGYLADDWRLAGKVREYIQEQTGIGMAWAMNEALGFEGPVKSRRHRVDELQRVAADRMQEAIGG